MHFLSSNFIICNILDLRMLSHRFCKMYLSFILMFHPQNLFSSIFSLACSLIDFACDLRYILMFHPQSFRLIVSELQHSTVQLCSFLDLACQATEFSISNQIFVFHYHASSLHVSEMQQSTVLPCTGPAVLIKTSQDVERAFKVAYSR